MLVLIRGAGDLASGVGHLLKTCGCQVVMTDLPHPTAIRRSVAFSPAITDGTAIVEGLTGGLPTPQKPGGSRPDRKLPFWPIRN